MTDNGTEVRKTKKLKRLVPVVQGRQRKSIKKPRSPTAAARREPKSETFHELVAAANSDAAWEMGSAPLRRRGKASFKTHLAFGGSKGTKLYDQETPKGHHHRQFSIKQESNPIKEEVAIEDEIEDVHRPIYLRARSDKDAERLLPRYLEERVLEMSSDGDDTDAAESTGLGSTSDDGGILFQLPSVFPYSRKKSEDAPNAPPLPEGKIGKLFIHKSGRLRLTMGDVSMDIGSGTPWPFHQQLIAINVRETDGHCVFLGDIERHAVCTLNLTTLLKSNDVEKPKEETEIEDGQKLVHPLIESSAREGTEVDGRETEMDLEDDVTAGMKIERPSGIDVSVEGMKLMPVDHQTTFTES